MASSVFLGLFFLIVLKVRCQAIGIFLVQRSAAAL